MKSVLLIVNRNAGRGGHLAHAERAAGRLRERGVAVALHPTRTPEEASGLLAQGSVSVDAVVAVGGDGTLRHMVSTMLGHPCRLGLIPRGTANVMARELGIPLDPEGAADVLVDGAPRAIDVGRIEHDGIFLAMVGVGLDAEIAHAVRPGKGKLLRFGLATTARICFPRIQELRLEVDGVAAPGPTYGLVIANTANYGGWFSMCPRARPDDGLLDFLQMRRRDRRALVRVLARAWRWHPSPAALASYGTGESFTVESLGGTEVPVQADGDAAGHTPVRISIVKEAVAIIAPRPGAPGDAEDSGGSS